jgi:hypothetical protein
MKNEQSDTRLFVQPWSKMANQTSLLLILPNRDVSTGPIAADQSRFALCADSRQRLQKFRHLRRRANGIAKTGSFAARILKMRERLSDENQQLSLLID